ncbi:type II secretion system protein GspG [Candidatus Falkowbacteria bacterium]|nr:type II secretion system protein GspG [Candidatus Falkowbacteria bacterium]
MIQAQPPKSSIVWVLLVFLLIGLLASATVFLLSSSQAKARDSKRLVDIARISTALEYYKLSHSTYPIETKALPLGVPQTQRLCDAKSGGFVAATAQCEVEYTKVGIPLDPSGDSYVYQSDGKGYTIVFITEKETQYGAPGTYFAHSKGINRDPKVQ